MTNPPSWSPEGSGESIGLGVVSGGKSIPRPLPGRAMAGLAGAIVAALGAVAYVASDFIDADPIETGSIASSAAASPNEEDVPVAKPVVAAARADKKPSLGAKVDESQPAELPSSSTASLGKSSASIVDVSNDLRKQIPPAQSASSVLVPPANPAQVADLAPDVAVAESEAEVAKLEAAIGMSEPAPESDMEIARLERAAEPSDAALDPTGDTAAMGGPFIPVSGMKATRVTRYVNLRNGPADEAGVVAVIPTNATVQAETNCGWCVVTYNGQRGYIYKGFLSGRGGGAKSTGGRSRAAKKLTGKPGLY
jgi:hypothetical protein